MEEEFDLKELFNAFWKRKLWIILAVLIGGVLGICYARFSATQEYTSRVSVLVAQDLSSYRESSGDYYDADYDKMLHNRLLSTYSALLKSRTAFNYVVEKLGLGTESGDYSFSYKELQELREGISSNDKDNTDIVVSSVRTKDAELSLAMVTELYKYTNEKIKDYYNIKNIEVIDEPELDKTPVEKHYFQNALTFGLVFGAFVVGIIFIRFYFDCTIKKPEDFKRIDKDVPVLASIPIINDSKKGDAK